VRCTSANMRRKDDDDPPSNEREQRVNEKIASVTWSSW
jgi:hypothetical protein